MAVSMKLHNQRMIKFLQHFWKRHINMYIFGDEINAMDFHELCHEKHEVTLLRFDQELRGCPRVRGGHPNLQFYHERVNLREFLVDIHVMKRTYNSNKTLPMEFLADIAMINFQSGGQKLMQIIMSEKIFPCRWNR